MRLSRRRFRPVIVAACATFLFANGCAGTPEGGDAELLGSTEQPITVCTTIQNASPGGAIVEDATILSDPNDPASTSTNFGSSPTLESTLWNGRAAASLMRFDLLGAGIPADATITNARLTLFILKNPGQYPVDVHEMHVPWTEDTATWSYISAFGGWGSPAATFALAGVPNNSPVTAVLPTSLVQPWLDPATNAGVVLYVGAPAVGSTSFASSETPVLAARPKLGICYIPPTCTDGAQNQGEGGIDCGGPCPNACPTCSDGVQNQGEVNVDCGGPCLPCCTPGDTTSCYGGPAATEGVGACVGGVSTCNANGAFGPCVGEVVPAAEQCNAPGQPVVDEDCDGQLNEGACPYVSIAATSHGSAIRADGLVWAWGNNDFGTLGDGTKVDQLSPIQVDLGPVDRIIRGGYHAIALRPDGTLASWGRNNWGQLGDGTFVDHLTPAPVSLLAGVAEMAQASNRGMAILTDGTLWSWGENSSGQLGHSGTTDSPTPTQVPGLGTVVKAAGGGYHSLALLSDTTLRAWGHGTSGELGDGVAADSLTPVVVSGLSGVVDVSAGSYYSTALLADGTVWAWGDNYNGELGDGTGIDSDVPVQTAGLTNVVALASTQGFSLALLADGTVRSWGFNKWGQLGDGTTTKRLAPVTVLGLSNVVAIATGGNNSMALKADGTVWAWGQNDYGGVGDGTTVDRKVPVQVPLP